MSDMDDIEQSIMAALRKAYQLGLDDASRGRGALEAEVKRLGELEASYPHYLLVNERDEARDRLAELVRRVREWAYDKGAPSVDALVEIVANYEVPK